MPDITITNCGSIFLFRPETETGREWISVNLPDDVLWCGEVVVEHRFAYDIAQGMMQDGLEVK